MTRGTIETVEDTDDESAVIAVADDISTEDVADMLKTVSEPAQPSR